MTKNRITLVDGRSTRTPKDSIDAFKELQFIAQTFKVNLRYAINDIHTIIIEWTDRDDLLEELQASIYKIRNVQNFMIAFQSNRSSIETATYVFTAAMWSIVIDGNIRINEKQEFLGFVQVSLTTYDDSTRWELRELEVSDEIKKLL
jgi:hypothetical protein